MTPEEIEEIRERVRSRTEGNCIVSPELARALLTALEEAEARVEDLEEAGGELLTALVALLWSRDQKFADGQERAIKNAEKVVEKYGRADELDDLAGKAVRRRALDREE